MKNFIKTMIEAIGGTISEPEHPAFGKHLETPDGKSFVFFSAQLDAHSLLKYLNDPPVDTPAVILELLDKDWRKSFRENLCPETLEYLKTDCCFAKITETADRAMFSDNDGHENEDVRYDLHCLCEICEEALAFIADRIQDQAQQRTLSDRLDEIREEAISAIEKAAEKGTIELLPEDIFDDDGCWIRRITTTTSGQLNAQIFSGDEDNHYLNYESDLLALKTDTLVQIADYLAKN